MIDVPRYKELLFRAVHEVLQPIGVTENILRDWMFSEVSYRKLDSKLRHTAELPLFAKSEILERALIGPVPIQPIDEGS